MTARRKWPLLLVLLLVFFLRLPTLFEPNWYGDEGIYLAVGQAIRRGAVLYRDIWDNKPPLLYLIYTVNPVLWWAKLTATAAVLGTTLGVYLLTRKLSTPPASQGVALRAWALTAAGVTGALLSLPLLEGTVANAELYFTLPIILGAYLLFTDLNTNHQSLVTPVMIGALLSAAFLLKIPAVFDFAGLILAALIIQKFKTVKYFLPLILVPLITLISLIIYFYSNHALPDFLTASLSQNASYVAVDSGSFSRLSNPLFVKAVFLVLVLLVLLVLFVKKKISRELLFLSFWFGFSLYGALLSSRPYLHYLLQIVPPGIILAGYFLTNFRKTIILNSLSPAAFGEEHKLGLGLFIILLFLVARNFTGAFALDSRTYYQNWFDYVSERKSWEEYAAYFDPQTLNSYAIANYLTSHTSPTDPVFVWGDNAFIYVLSGRPPATKFIQAHHLSTIPPENYDLVAERLIKFPPKYIIISHPVRFPFPKLEQFVARNYRLEPEAVFQEYFLYRKIP